MGCIVQQGSIAINGVSLTVANVGDDWFEVALIPTTLEFTTLGDLRSGDRVNLETDYIAKIVINWLRRYR
jgi:riboflavin synthase